MKIKYLKACQAEGLTEDQIREIDQIFDADKKRRKRDRENRRKNGITFVYIDHLRNDDERSENMQIADPRVDVEKQVFQQMAMDYLQECLDEMNEFDRNLLLEYYDGAYGVETALAKKYGWERTKLHRHRIRLENELKEKFRKKFGD